MVLISCSIQTTGQQCTEAGLNSFADIPIKVCAELWMYQTVPDSCSIYCACYKTFQVNISYILFWKIKKFYVVFFKRQMLTDSSLTSDNWVFTVFNWWRGAPLLGLHKQDAPSLIWGGGESDCNKLKLFQACDDQAVSGAIK